MIDARAILVVLGAAVLPACSAAGEGSSARPPGAGGGGAGAGGGPGAGAGGGAGAIDGGGPHEGGGWVGDPKTCAHAEASKSYVGCDYWPTVLPNYVGTHFDYAVVVANAGDAPADVTVARGGQTVATAQVPPSALVKLFLPWVPELKHYNGACDTDPSPPLAASARVAAGAYHVTSTVPVTVYQFNPLEYGPKGGPAGKDWSKCKCLFGCNSYTNDASLLLPSTALTGSYVVPAPAGQSNEKNKVAGFVSVTGLVDGTTVAVKVGAKGKVVPGGGVAGGGAGEVFSFPIARGEVVRLLGTPETDLSGTIVQASAPVQVMSGSPCIMIPADREACDHVEEIVFPAETLGKRYFVTRPTGPAGGPVGHLVRIVGVHDGTALSYPSGAPAGAPAAIGAGQSVDVGIVEKDFEVVGSQAFAVSTYMLGHTLVDPNLMGAKGDPSQSAPVAVEQFRTKCVFLAPDDYDVSYADVVAPAGTKLVLDSTPVGAASVPLGSGHVVVRIPLGPGAGGAHVIEGDQPFGLQVMGYGFATSYQYPGGLNLKGISPPPAPVK